MSRKIQEFIPCHKFITNSTRTFKKTLNMYKTRQSVSLYGHGTTSVPFRTDCLDVTLTFGIVPRATVKSFRVK